MRNEEKKKRIKKKKEEERIMKNEEGSKKKNEKKIFLNFISTIWHYSSAYNSIKNLFFENDWS